MTAITQQCRHCGKTVRGLKMASSSDYTAAALCPECAKPLWSSKHWSDEDLEMFCGAFPSLDVVSPVRREVTATPPFVIPARPDIRIPAASKRVRSQDVPVCVACGHAECSCLLDAFADTVLHLKTPDGQLYPTLRDKTTGERFTNRDVRLPLVIAELQEMLPGVDAQQIADDVEVSEFPEDEFSFENGSGGKLRDPDVSPYNTWKPLDRGRWWRNKGTADIQNPDRGDPKTGKPPRVSKLVGLQIETDGAFGFDESGNANQLWVCRICRTDLTGGQRAYCSKACANVMEAARARAGTAIPWTTRTTGHGDLSMNWFSLDGIKIAGYGPLCTPPAVWNAIDKTDSPHSPAPRRHWIWPSLCQQLTPAEIAAGWGGPASDARSVLGLLLTPDMLRSFVWHRHADDLDTRTPDEWADRLARRYGTGGAPLRRCGRFGCQQIPGKTANSRRQERFCSYYCEERGSTKSWEEVRGGFKFPAGRTALMCQDGVLREPFVPLLRGSGTWIAG